MAYVNGVGIDWAGVHDAYDHKHISLPSYAFDRKSYWYNTPRPRGALDYSAGGSGVLGRQIEPPFLSKELTVFEHEVRLDRTKYLQDHQIDGMLLIPGAYFMDMALQGSSNLEGAEGLVQRVCFENFSLPRGLCMESVTESATVQMGM